MSVRIVLTSRWPLVMFNALGLLSVLAVAPPGPVKGLLAFLVGILSGKLGDVIGWETALGVIGLVVVGLGIHGKEYQWFESQPAWFRLSNPSVRIWTVIAGVVVAVVGFASFDNDRQAEAEAQEPSNTPISRDADRDGYSNTLEFYWGSSGFDPSSTPPFWVSADT